LSLLCLSCLSHAVLCRFHLRCSPYLTMCSFFLSCGGDLQDLLSFPTRRSSDLWKSAKKNMLNAIEKDLDTRFAGVKDDMVLGMADRKSTRLNSSHVSISYAVFCLKKKRRARMARRRSVTGWKRKSRKRKRLTTY